jgi:two-component system chemotaxis sensor kinase CheA
MSVADFTDLFVKTIRNLAKGYDREVRLEVIGGDVQADIALLDRLREPVMHLFRNAVAHGIESPEERMSAGKGPEGTITLEARRERDSLIIVIRDDGRGIDRSSIAGHLRDTRSMTDEQIHQMPRDDFFNTILSPDFSSSSKATDLAGRGIGMSVVSQTIAYLGASMNIRSEPSKGTEFTVRLPLSLAVIHAVTFVIGAYTLSVPTSSVESIGMREHVSTEDSDALYNLRALFGVNGGRKAFFILKLKHLAQTDSNNIRGEFRELAVDRIIGNGPLMVMPVGELLAKVGLLAGVGITENGDISLLLDLENLPEM